MTIPPDTKDWTFVLQSICPECRFDVRTFPREQVGSMIRANAARWKHLLMNPDVTERPSDTVWSALEYGCHVRDVFRLYDERLQMMLEEDDPSYPNWDQDEAAIKARYSEQDPRHVSADLRGAAVHLAERFDGLRGSQWDRTGTRGDGARFTVESFARYLIHDPVHHIHDVERGYQILASGRDGAPA